MKAITRGARALARDERGLTTVEYAIVLCLIAAVAVGTWQVFGSNVKGYLAGASKAIAGELDKSGIEKAE